MPTSLAPTATAATIAGPLPGVSVKDHAGTQDFVPGSLFAINVDERSRVSVSSGVSLTIATVTAATAAVSDTNGNHDINTSTTTTLQYNSSIALCHLTKNQPTITGLGLTWSGPQTFELSVTGGIGAATTTTTPSMSVLGTIVNTTTTPTTTTTTMIHNVANSQKSPVTPFSLKNISSSGSEKQSATTTTTTKTKPKASKKRKLDKSSHVDVNDVLPTTNTTTTTSPPSKKEVSCLKNTNNNKNDDDEKKNDTTHMNTTTMESSSNITTATTATAATTTKLSKRQRRQLAKQKAKDLERTVAQLNGHDVVVEEEEGGGEDHGTTNTTASSTVTTTTATTKEKKKKMMNKLDVSSVTKERRLAGGVLVRDLILGHGDGGGTVQLGRKVSILYEGSLLESGKVFDRKKTKPLEFRYGTGQVIRGLERGLEGMKVGGRRDITIPPEMAYGKKGSGLVIPPNATLVFSVELVSVGNK